MFFYLVTMGWVFDTSLCDNSINQRVNISSLSLAEIGINTTQQCVCCVCVIFPFILDVWLVDVPAGVTQEEGHTGFLIHLPFAVLPFIFIARRIQPFLSLVDREVEMLCTNELLIVLHLLGIYLFIL